MNTLEALKERHPLRYEAALAQARTPAQQQVVVLTRAVAYCECRVCREARATLPAA